MRVHGVSPVLDLTVTRSPDVATGRGLVGALVSCRSSREHRSMLSATASTSPDGSCKVLDSRDE